MKNVKPIYIARYENIIIAVSKSKKYIKQYLKHTRKLVRDEYTIEEVYSINEYELSQYNDSLVVEYTKDLYLTYRDINYLDRELTTTIENMKSTITDMKSYYRIINTIPNMNNVSKTLKKSIYELENIIYNKNQLSKIKISIIHNSPVIRCNIDEYLFLMNLYTEINYLDDMYRYHNNKEE